MIDLLIELMTLELIMIEFACVMIIGLTLRLLHFEFKIKLKEMNIVKCIIIKKVPAASVEDGREVPSIR